MYERQPTSYEVFLLLPIHCKTVDLHTSRSGRRDNALRIKYQGNIHGSGQNVLGSYSSMDGFAASVSVRNYPQESFNPIAKFPRYSDATLLEEFLDKQTHLQLELGKVQLGKLDDQAKEHERYIRTRIYQSRSHAACCGNKLPTLGHQ